MRWIDFLGVCSIVQIFAETFISMNKSVNSCDSISKKKKKNVYVLRVNW